MTHDQLVALAERTLGGVKLTSWQRALLLLVTTVRDTQHATRDDFALMPPIMASRSRRVKDDQGSDLRFLPNDHGRHDPDSHGSLSPRCWRSRRGALTRCCV